MKITKKILQTALTLAIALMAFQFTGVSASAQGTKIETNDYVLASPGASHYYGIGLINANDYKITKVVSSDTQVAKIKKDEYGFYYYPLKAGKVTLTATIKKGTTKKTITKNIQVIDKKLFTSIKYGTKDLYTGNKYGEVWYNGLKSGKKLSWKLKDGYKISYVTIYDKNGTRKIKNNSVIKFSTKDYAFADFHIKAPNGKIIWYTLNLNNPYA